MQRRHSASIMGRHQDNTYLPKQVQYWFNSVDLSACTHVCAISACTGHVQKESHLIGNDEVV